MFYIKIRIAPVFKQPLKDSSNCDGIWEQMGFFLLSFICWRRPLPEEITKACNIFPKTCVVNFNDYHWRIQTDGFIGAFITYLITDVEIQAKYTQFYLKYIDQHPLHGQGDANRKLPAISMAIQSTTSKFCRDRLRWIVLDYTPK